MCWGGGGWLTNKERISPKEDGIEKKCNRKQAEQQQQKTLRS